MNEWSWWHLQTVLEKVMLFPCFTKTRKQMGAWRYYSTYFLTVAPDEGELSCLQSSCCTQVPIKKETGWNHSESEHGEKSYASARNQTTIPWPCRWILWKTVTLWLYKVIYKHVLSNLITVQQDATYSVYYISVGSSTCFGCWHPSSGARTTVITASSID